MQSNKTRTLTLSCDDLLHVLITEPISQNDVKTPVTITISASPISSTHSISHSSEVLSCIYYVIPNYKKYNSTTSTANTPSSQSASSNKYFLTTLQEYTDNNDLKEFGKKMCILNYQLYGSKNPVYVIIPGTLEITSSMDMMMFLNAYKQSRQGLKEGKTY